MADANYETRYCAFVDILGFSELIDKLDRGETPFRSLQALLEKIHNPPPTNAGGMEKSDFRAQSISDAVALSGADNILGVAAIFHSINRLAIDLLKEGFFIRGAIVKDKLYHDDKTVFGKALVRAYQLEDTVVKYPRVMVTREVISDIREAAPGEKGEFDLLRRAEDGPMFLHVLRDIEMQALPFKLGSVVSKVTDERFHGKLDPYLDIPNQIQRRFDEATDNPNHFEKVKWFAHYWNDTIEKWGCEGFKRVMGPGVDPKPAYWG